VALLAAALILSSCNLFEPQWDTERLNDPPTWGRPLSPDAIMMKPARFWHHPLHVRGYIHYSGDDPTIARLVPSREMVLAPPPDDNSLWVQGLEGDISRCHGEYVEVFGEIEIEELKETGSDRIYALKPTLMMRWIDGDLEWFGEVPSAFESPVIDPSEFKAIKAERLALREIDDTMTCVTFKNPDAAE